MQDVIDRARALGTAIASHQRTKAFLAISIFVGIKRPAIKSANLPLHIARSISGWTGISLLFAAVAFIPLADATAISFLIPVFAMVLAIPLLGERVGPLRFSAAAIALAAARHLVTSGAIPAGTTVAVVLSGGNVDLDDLPFHGVQQQ